MARNIPRGQVRIHSVGREIPSFARRVIHRRGRRRAGEIYEARVQTVLEDRFPLYVGSLWFHYSDDEGQKWCQPDGLLFDPWKGRITICEIKSQHTPRAHEQLFDIYTPVVEAAFPEYSTAGIEICRWFDPAVSCQRRPKLCDGVQHAKPSEFNVHILWLR